MVTQGYGARERDDGEPQGSPFRERPYPDAAAQAILVGIELMHMLKKGQRVVEEAVEGLTPAEQFYVLAA